MKKKHTSNNEKETKFKNFLLAISTLVAFASLVLNFFQFREREQLQLFDYLGEYPTVTTFRIMLSKNNIDSIVDLAKTGTQFSYIPNPSFLNNDEIYNILDDTAIVQFFVVVNENNDIPITELELLHNDKVFPNIDINYLAPNSTLLIPELIHRFGKDDEVIGNISEIHYRFAIGANELSSSILVSPPNSEVVILEVGLGPIPKLQVPFEEP